jgi:5'-nucleotidase
LQQIPFPILTLAVSSQSLFAAGWNGQGGVRGWRDHQRAHEDVPMAPGPAFNFVSRLLELNTISPVKKALVDVGVVSRQDPSVSVRFLNSLEAHGLAPFYSRGLSHASYLKGESPMKVLETLKPHLFLSTRLRDVRQALSGNFGAAHLEPFAVPAAEGDAPAKRPSKLAVDFDGDAVAFCDEGEARFVQGGLAAFNAHEMAQAHVPLGQGPLYGFLMALGRLRSVFEEAKVPVPLRLRLVTARGFAGQKRAKNTVKSWNFRFDEELFLSGGEKGRYLRSGGAALFFDDTLRNIRSAREHGVPAAHVPFGVKNAPKARGRKP